MKNPPTYHKLEGRKMKLKKYDMIKNSIMKTQK